jgi:hypothetical protein
MIAAPDSFAAAMIPGLARINGPRGPSGVTPMFWPSASARTIARKAASPPLDFDPVMVPRPKCAIASAMIRPSAWPEISMFMLAPTGQAFGAISSLPCQKARMKGRPSRQKGCGCLSPAVSKRLVSQTRRM